MKFHRAGSEYLESDCGRYTVSRTGPWGGVRYIAWRRVPGKTAEHLGIFTDPERAQDCARKHAEGKR